MLSLKHQIIENHNTEINPNKKIKKINKYNHMSTYFGLGNRTKKYLCTYNKIYNSYNFPISFLK